MNYVREKIKLLENKNIKIYVDLKEFLNKIKYVFICFDLVYNENLRITKIKFDTK